MWVKNFAYVILRATTKGLTISAALDVAIDGYNKGGGIISKYVEVGYYSLETGCKFCYEHR